MSSLWCLVSFCGVLPGLWLEIRLEILTLMVSWFPPHGVLPGWWLQIRLEMLFLMVSWFPFVVSSLWCRGFHPMVSWCHCFHPVVSWFPPCGVHPMVSTPWCRSFQPMVSTPWCRGFHPCGVHPVVSWFPPCGILQYYGCFVYVAFNFEHFNGIQYVHNKKGNQDTYDKSN